MPDYGYQIGDRVFYELCGYGTVVFIRSDDMPLCIGVRFDEYMYGHDCGGACEDGYGLWFAPRALTRVGPAKTAIDPTEFLTLLGGDSHVVPSR